MAASTARRGIWIGLTAVFVLLIGLGMWFALSARAAVNEMTVARDSLVAARDAVTNGQPQQAQTFITAASNSASAAADRMNGPLWKVAAAVPVLGDTPRTAQAVATSLDQTLIALQPLTGQLNLLDPTSLTRDGQIDVATIQDALPSMKQAEPGLNEAVATMESAPADGAVLPQVRSAAEQFTEELDEPAEHGVHRGAGRRDRRTDARGRRPAALLRGSPEPQRGAWHGRLPGHLRDRDRGRRQTQRR